MVLGKKLVQRTSDFMHLCSSLFLAYLSSVVAAQLNSAVIRLAGLDWLVCGGYFFHEFSIPQ